MTFRQFRKKLHTLNTMLELASAQDRIGLVEKIEQKILELQDQFPEYSENTWL